MIKEIKKLREQTNKAEVALYQAVMDLGNHMNKCNCDDLHFSSSVRYDFVNTISHHEVHTFCLNCGGFITLTEI